MAIDDERKRRTAIMFSLPVPDGEIDQQDRISVAWIYAIADIFNGIIPFIPPRMFFTRGTRQGHKEITSRTKTFITDRVKRRD